MSIVVSSDFTSVRFCFAFLTVNERFRDVTSTCTRVGILGKAAVDTSPRKHVVVPPFCKKPPATSGTFEALESDASDGVERHPTKRRYERWRCGFENSYS
jgi:hypothetical protein